MWSGARQGDARSGPVCGECRRKMSGRLRAIPRAGRQQQDRGIGSRQAAAGEGVYTAQGILNNV